jgi:hypothetical protein
MGKKQAVAPSQHHHDCEFGERGLVAICIAQGDALRQRGHIAATVAFPQGFEFALLTLKALFLGTLAVSQAAPITSC